MKFLPFLAIFGLVLTILPPLLHLVSSLDLQLTFYLMGAGMVLWFVTAVPWLFIDKKAVDDSKT